MASILVVDDERKMGVILKGELEDHDHRVTVAQDGATAIRLVKEHLPDLVITDIRMEPVDGLAVLREVKKLSPETDVIMMTAYATTETAIEALRQGAAEYLTKPLDFDEVKFAVDRAIERLRLRAENRQLKEELSINRTAPDMVAVSEAMKRVMALAEKVARTDATVLITGESGVGKELVAQAIHKSSPRAGGPMIAVSCAALSESLLESELFGHERGAFTGATTRKLGRFELAHGGTLFLDEIGDIGANVQVKLLRALETREFERVGGTESIKCDVRILAATNKSLEEENREGRFRGDLLFRLNVFPIHIPPLRERPEDIVPIAQMLLGNRTLSPEAVQALKGYGWPGNGREIRNVVERATILAENEEIVVNDLLLPNSGAAQGGPAITSDNLVLADHERALIGEALKRSGGNKTEAAVLLGISRRALYSRSQSLGISLV